MKKNKNEIATNPDLEDSPQDKKRLRGDKATLDLPDVKDIPGQENSQPIPPGLLGDATASSDDEEGSGLLDENQESNDSNVSPFERGLIDKAYEQLSTDDEPIDRLTLDNKDNDGERLNETGLDKDLFGEDLDMPLIKEEDEEDDEEDKG